MKLKQYEVTFKSKKKLPYMDIEYGFGTNPPAIVYGKTKMGALKRLRLPKHIKIKSIKESKW